MQQLGANRETKPASWGAADWLVIGLAFALGALNMPQRVVGWQFDHVPGDGHDNRLNNFILEHGYRYLSGRADSFWDAPLFYPAPGITAYSDAHIGLLPLYSAFRFAGLSPECAFQGWFIVPFILNFAAAIWALRRLGAGSAGAAAGACVFAFGLPVAGQFGHAQLLPRFFAPLAFVFAWEYLRTARTRRLALCCACVVAQFYVSVYVGCFLVMLLAGGLLAAAVFYPMQLPWRAFTHAKKAAWCARLAVVGAAALALLPLLWRHAHGVGSVGGEWVRALAPPPRGWLTPPHLALANSLLTNPGDFAEVEYRVFPGFIALASLGVGLLNVLWAKRLGSWPSVVAVASWATLAIMFAVTVFDGFWLYGVVTEVPGGCCIRAIGRVILVLLFPLGIAVAAVVDALAGRAGRLGRPAAIVAGVILVAVVAADQWLISTGGEHAAEWAGERTPRASLVSRQERVQEEIRRWPNARVVFVLPNYEMTPEQEDSRQRITMQLEAMRATQDLGIPCVNGYSGYFPQEWKYFSDEAGIRKWFQYLGAPPEKTEGLVLVGVGPP